MKYQLINTYINLSINSLILGHFRIIGQWTRVVLHNFFFYCKKGNKTPPHYSYNKTTARPVYTIAQYLNSNTFPILFVFSNVNFMILKVMILRRSASCERAESAAIWTSDSIVRWLPQSFCSLSHLWLWQFDQTIQDKLAYVPCPNNFSKQVPYSALLY